MYQSLGFCYVSKQCLHPKVKWYPNAVFKVILFSFSLEILIDLKLILSCMWDTVSVTFHTGVTSVPCTCASSLYLTSARPCVFLTQVRTGGFGGLLSLYPTSTRPWVFLTRGCTGGFGGLLNLYPTSAWPSCFSHGSAGRFWDLLLLPFLSASHFLPHWNCGLRRTRPPELSLKL